MSQGTTDTSTSIRRTVGLWAQLADSVLEGEALPLRDLTADDLRLLLS